MECYACMTLPSPGLDDTLFDTVLTFAVTTWSHCQESLMNRIVLLIDRAYPNLKALGRRITQLKTML